MTFSLENPHLQIAIPEPADFSWSIYSRKYPKTCFINARMKFTYRSSDARQWTTDHFQGSGQPHRSVTGSPLGHLEQASWISLSQDRQLRLTLTFALPQRASCLLWKVDIENISNVPMYLGKIELLRLAATKSLKPGDPLPFCFGPATRPDVDLAFFSNGWQSWNYTGTYSSSEQYRSTRLGPFTTPMRVNAGRPRPKTPGHIVSDMFGVLGDRKSRLGALIGFLSQQENFGTIETHLQGPRPDLRLWADGDAARLDPGRRMTTDWAYLSFINLDDPDPLGDYFDSVARQHGLLPPMSENMAASSSNHWTATPVGWCSWYYYYGQVTANDVRTNLVQARQLADRLPLEMIQIDDGFQTKVGDWYSFQPTFPNGPAPLAKEIRAAGFTPGIWLAPFTVLPGSKIAANHPDWLLRGRLNRPVNAGYSSWGEFSTALDLTHPEALCYAQEVVQTAANKWGFPYLKLDFLYAGALPGKHRDPTRTRAQILRHGLQGLRDCVGHEVTILGCGCPLGPAIGLVDAMRIGADVSDRWKPAFAGIEFFFEAEPDYPSTRNALQNIITRTGMHQRWWVNDPDCLLVRPNSKLSLAEIQSLATAISLSGGSLFLSDDLAALPENRIMLAASLLPLLPGRMQVIDWFDAARPACLRLDLNNQTGSWSLLAVFNWQDEPRDLALRPVEFGLDPKQAYWLREFWAPETHYLSQDDTTGLALTNTAPHGVRLLAVRTASNSQACYLGSNLHISQGLEVSSWNPGVHNLQVQLERPGTCQGTIEIYLPMPPKGATLNGRQISCHPGGEGRYNFYLDFNKTAKLNLAY